MQRANLSAGAFFALIRPAPVAAPIVKRCEAGSPVTRHELNRPVTCCMNAGFLPATSFASHCALFDKLKRQCSQEPKDESCKCVSQRSQRDESTGFPRRSPLFQCPVRSARTPVKFTSGEGNVICEYTITTVSVRKRYPSLS